MNTVNPKSAVCPTLKESQESRVRAWKALQRIREVLEMLSDDRLPPPSKPSCFETEGQVLRTELLAIMRRLNLDLEHMQEAVEKVRPFIGAKEGHGSFPDAVIGLNRAVGRIRDWTGTFALAAEKTR
ncbi:MAG: hypothetical protein ABMA13_00665 [Chthoniobacteraceae bacterium]